MIKRGLPGGGVHFMVSNRSGGVVAGGVMTPPGPGLSRVVVSAPRSWSRRCSAALPEDPVHGGGALVDDRAQLLAVDGLGDRGAAGVTDEACDLLDRHTFVGEQRDEAVAQFARCPVFGGESCGGGDAADAAADVGRVQRSADRGGS